MPDIVISKTYEDGEPLFELDLDNIRDGITIFLNDTKIDSDNIQDAGIETAKIQDSSIVAAKLATDSVETDKIKNANVTKEKLASDVEAFLVPTGTILPYGGASAPAGFVLCDGATLDRTTFAPLFAIIASAFGDGDGATTFHVPDFRGRFMRGVDDGTGTDIDAGTRTAMNVDGNTGDNVGSVQGDTTRNHTHLVGAHTHASGGYVAEWRIGGTGIEWDSKSAVSTWTADTSISILGVPGATGGSSTTSVDVAGTSASGGNFQTATMSAQTGEARPKNGYVNYIIKI